MEVSWRLGLIDVSQRRRTPAWKLRPLLGFREDHLPIAYFAATRPDGKWPNPLADHR